MTPANPTHDPPRQLNPEETVSTVSELAADRKALDIVQLDLRGMIGYADYFVICSGRTDRQTRPRRSTVLRSCVVPTSRRHRRTQSIRKRLLLLPCCERRQLPN